MAKKLTGVFLLVLVALVLVVLNAWADNDTCVVHKGREIWVNHNALQAHLNHGDTLCADQNPDPTPIVPPGPPPNPVPTDTPENWLKIYLSVVFGNNLY